MKALARCTSDPGRYRIVEEKYLNGKAHYELWFHEPRWWNKDRWVIEERITDYGNVVPHRFDTEEEVYQHIRSIVRTRKVVKEGRVSL